MTSDTGYCYLGERGLARRYCETNAFRWDSGLLVALPGQTQSLSVVAQGFDSAGAGLCRWHREGDRWPAVGSLSHRLCVVIDNAPDHGKHLTLGLLAAWPTDKTLRIYCQ
ncbi:hypothetical protein GCM10023194_47350 [Planotetraspora phitsanulokensis]|uniref:Uncharacterized protein n=1 Tax=Planotetraspora phitsanulokensis TaxID=575192 RepID=A0A8J3UH32_9ACTN|nr:hypothetical protein Pph01_81740 [Planotetraspora phitsanulokensis]